MSKDKIGIIKIDDYLNKESDFNEEELKMISSTDTIDIDQTSDAMFSIQDSIKECYNEVVSSNGAIISLLDLSNSQLLSTGQEAKQKRQYLQDIEQEFSDMYEMVYEMEYEKIVEDYNDKLMVLQNGRKLQLLRKLADNINKLANSKNTKYKYDESHYEVTETEYNQMDKFKESYEHVPGLAVMFINIENESNRDNTKYYTIGQYEVAYCDYSDLFPETEWYTPDCWTDEKVTRFEDMINVLHVNFPNITIPYE